MTYYDKLFDHLKKSQQITNTLIEYYQRQIKTEQQQLKLTQAFKKQLLQVSKTESKQIKKLFQQYSNIFNRLDQKSDYIVSINLIIPKLNLVKQQINKLLTTSIGFKKSDINGTSNQKEQNKKKLRILFCDYLEQHQKTLREIIQFNSKNSLVDNTRSIQITTSIMSKIYDIKQSSSS